MSKNLNLSFLVLFSLLIIACNQTGYTPPAPADLEGFTLANHPGGKLQKALSADANGKIVAEGELLEGVKTGAWITYYPDDGRVKSVTNYINGSRNGLHIEFSNRGSVDKQCFFTNDQLDGPYMTYRNGSRKLIECNYKNGVLEGKYYEYNDKTNKVRKDMSYVNGKLDGQFKQFNDDGQLVMEYQYKMGEKISGGIVEVKPEE